MATVQAFYFTLNNSTSFDCTAHSGDAIRCEAVVTFSGAEIGKRYWVNWIITQPNGQDFAPYSEYAYAESTTTFYQNDPLPGLEEGTYTMIRLEVNQG